MNVRALLLAGVFAVPVLGAGMIESLSAPALADSSDKTRKADIIRRTAQARAKSQIGYPDIFDYVIRDTTGASNDFHVLSRQIEQLSRYLRAVSRTLKQPETAALGPLAGIGYGGVRDVYGPDGPTVKSVRLIMEYRLMVAGNPRLRPGQVRDTGASIRARVVTADGSLVEEYDIDKKTGEWRTVRD